MGGLSAESPDLVSEGNLTGAMAIAADNKGLVKVVVVAVDAAAVVVAAAGAGAST